MVLRVESKASHVLGKSFIMKPHPQPPPKVPYVPPHYLHRRSNQPVCVLFNLKQI